MRQLLAYILNEDVVQKALIVTDGNYSSSIVPPSIVISIYMCEKYTSKNV